MISLYSGTPGSGKSNHATQEIYERLSLNKNVIGNFEINRDIARMTTLGYIKYSLHKKFKINFKKYNMHKKFGSYYDVDNIYLTPQFLINVAKKFHKKTGKRESQTLVVIDECGILFNTRTWDSKNRLEWIKFFSMHRHYGFDFILISQSDRMIERQIRCLLEYDCKHRDGKHCGLFGLVLSLLQGGHFFCCVTYWYGVREKVGFKYLPVSQRIFDLYDTFTVFDNEEQKILDKE